MAIYGPAVSNKYSPVFGQQRPQPSMSIPMGGFMGQNQIGGQSTMNIYRSPNSQLAPTNQQYFPGSFGSGQMGSMPGQLSSLGSSIPDQPSLFDQRAEQYQEGLAEFNLGQRESELLSQKRSAKEIASGQFMVNGEAVSREERDQYQKGIEEQSRIRNSLSALRRDPSKFLMGSNLSNRPSGEDLNQLNNYLGQASQLFRASGQEGNLMDFVLGKKVYRPGTSYASQGFTPETAKASLGMESSPEDEMKQFNLRTFQRAAPGTDF